MNSITLPTEEKQPSYQSLQDYRRSVSDMYTRLRQSPLSEPQRCLHFRRERDKLFRSHPQSALSLEQKSSFKTLAYYPYNPIWRFVLPLDGDVEPEIIEIALQHDGLTRLQRFGKIHFTVAEQTVSLSVFWILGYGGGVFLPFRDLTTGDTTYGGGRYLLDAIKHADLGQENNKLVIDFNYAYNPSCAYNPAWYCPLAPLENQLPVPITAGEQRYHN